MVCDLLDKKFINYVAFDINPAKVRRCFGSRLGRGRRLMIVPSSHRPHPHIHTQPNPTQPIRTHTPTPTLSTDPHTRTPSPQVIEARNRGLPVFFGDVSRPEVLRGFNVDKARAVVVTTNDMRSTNKAVVTLRKL